MHESVRKEVREGMKKERGGGGREFSLSFDNV